MKVEMLMLTLSDSVLQASFESWDLTSAVGLVLVAVSAAPVDMGQGLNKHLSIVKEAMYLMQSCNY